MALGTLAAVVQKKRKKERAPGCGGAPWLLSKEMVCGGGRGEEAGCGRAQRNGEAVCGHFEGSK